MVGISGYEFVRFAAWALRMVSYCCLPFCKVRVHLWLRRRSAHAAGFPLYTQLDSAGN